jgi:threonine/homoserine/homoserine lactone efflux protein
MEFLLLASAHFLALLSPGPDFFIIIQTALKKPLCYAFSVCAGIASANALYLLVAVLGLEVIKEMPMLMLVLKYLGGAYLVFLGVMLLKSKKIDINVDKNQLQIKSLKAEFVIGFLSGFLNPKNAIFYLSLFTLMVSAETSLFTRTLYALWMSFLVLFWDMGIAVLIGNENVKNRLSRWIYLIEKISGFVLASFGLVLVW